MPQVWEQASVDEFEDSQARARPALMRPLAASDALAVSPRSVARRSRNLVLSPSSRSIPLQFLLPRLLTPRTPSGLVRPCRPDGRQGSGFESPRRGGGGTASLRAPAVAEQLVSTWERTCEASRPRPARAPHHAPRLPPHTHRPRTRCPLLPLTLPPLSLAFGRRWRRSDSRFRACEKARPQPRSAPAPARPASALLAARGGGRLAPVAGHAAAAVAAARAALTRACVLARAGRFCVLPGAEEDPPHVPRRPDDRPAAARRRRVHHAPSPPSTPPEIHSNTHLHPHNLLLPNPRGEPSSPTRPRSRMSSRVVVPRPSGGV